MYCNGIEKGWGGGGGERNFKKFKLLELDETCLVVYGRFSFVSYRYDILVVSIGKQGKIMRGDESDAEKRARLRENKFRNESVYSTARFRNFVGSLASVKASSVNNSIRSRFAWPILSREKNPFYL